MMDKCFQFVRIGNEILMSIRSSKKEKNETSIHSPIGIDKEGNEISLTG